MLSVTSLNTVFFFCGLGYWFKKMVVSWGAWVAQLVRQPTLAQVMMSQLVGWSPALGSVLTAQSLAPASDIVSLPLSTPPLLKLCVSLSLNNK